MVDYILNLQTEDQGIRRSCRRSSRIPVQLAVLMRKEGRGRMRSRSSATDFYHRV